jgi:flagella basal body P-ring formation protein FlgA
MKSGNFLCVFSLFFIPHMGHAQDNVQLEVLVSSAKAYLQRIIDKQPSFASNKQVTIYSFPLDSRLKLEQCDKPLTFSRNQNTQLKGTTSVKASCRGSHPWSIYTKHRISATKSVLVINKNLPRNHIIKDSDINYVAKDTQKLRNGYITDKALVLGHKLKRPVKEGKPIYSHQIATVELIKKGDKVNISARMGKLTVVTSGIALDAGQKGDQIDVENVRSSRVIRTRVIGVNTVEVIM